MDCKHCGMPDAMGCDDISLPPGQHGRSNRCYLREIDNLKRQLAAATSEATVERNKRQTVERQLAAANERAGRMEKGRDELQARIDRALGKTLDGMARIIGGAR